MTPASLVAAWLLAFTASAGATTYLVTDVAPSEGGDSPPSINRAGVVAGTAALPEGRRAFRYASGTLQVLDSRNDISAGRAINDRGDVAGDCAYKRWNTRQACFWRGDSLKGIGALSLGRNSQATGINRQRQVAGWSFDALFQVRAFRYSHGSMVDLGTLGNSSEATAINELGQVAGYSSLGLSGPFHAFLHDGTQLRDLGTLPGSGNNSFAYALDDEGTAVGASDLGIDRHAVMFKDGTVIDLGTLGGFSSAALGLNRRGEVVGWSDTVRHETAAFVWRNGRMSRLDGLLDPTTGAGWTLFWATGVNDAGQIVGLGRRDGAERVFLLTPMD